MISIADRNYKGQSESIGEKWRVVGDEVIKGGGGDITYTLQDIAELPIDSLPENCTTEQARDTIKSYILASELTEDEITAILSLYEPFVVGEIYTQEAVDKGILRTYEGSLYKVNSPHTTQSDWTPDVATSLFTVVTPPGVIAEWVQPTSAENAYNIGAQVTFEGVIYESTINANTTSPSLYPTWTYWVPVD